MTIDRNERLAADHRDLLKIQNRPYLSWVATKGELPFAEEYLLTVRIRTYAFSVKTGKSTVGVIDRCTISVRLRDSYPQVAPYIKMISIPPVFHPNWYSKGTYCSSEPWRPEMSLKAYILRMIDTLRYTPELIGDNAPANYKALDWFKKNQDNAALFPSDKTELTENDPQEIDAAEDVPTFNEIVDSW